MTTLSSGHIREDLERDLRDAVATALLGEKITGEVAVLVDQVVAAVMDCLGQVRVERQVDERLQEVEEVISTLTSTLTERLRKSEAARGALERRIVQMHGHLDADCPGATGPGHPEGRDFSPAIITALKPS